MHLALVGQVVESFLLAQAQKPGHCDAGHCCADEESEEGEEDILQQHNRER